MIICAQIFTADDPFVGDYRSCRRPGEIRPQLREGMRTCHHFGEGPEGETLGRAVGHRCRKRARRVESEAVLRVGSRRPELLPSFEGRPAPIAQIDGPRPVILETESVDPIGQRVDIGQLDELGSGEVPLDLTPRFNLPQRSGPIKEIPNVIRRRLVLRLLAAPSPCCAQPALPGSRRPGRSVRQMQTEELQTPALLLQADALEHNLATMSALLPGDRLRPHVKAHKCTALAQRQRAHGHHGFTLATIREVEGMAAAGLGDDLLLANEVADARRLGHVVESGARVTLAVDSLETIAAAANGGVQEVVIDVNVGLPRCGCDPSDAGRLADAARARRLTVRGVMGYEGHLMMVLDQSEQRARVGASMALLLRAQSDVGGTLVSAGGTGTHHLNIWANEIQAGSYALMDSAYAQHGFGFRQALWIEATVVARNAKGWAVADCGLKAHGMDHGNPAIPGAEVLFLSDEHITFRPEPDGPLADLSVGSRVRVIPAHCDPTVAYHEAMWLVQGDEVLDRWAVDLRGW